MKQFIDGTVINEHFVKENAIKRNLRVFKNGFVQQIISGGTFATSATVGIYQGLKYSGSLKRGITAGLATEAVFATINGVRNVISYHEWDKTLS